MSKDKMPSIQDQTETRALSQEEIEFLLDLRKKVDNDDSDRSQWKTKCIVANNQRLGIKRYSEYPYPGAPNFPLPETDKLIKKQVPNLVLSAWAPKKMCLVNVKEGYAPNSDWEEKATKAEGAINMLLRSEPLDWFMKLCYAADYAKEKGHCLFRVREEFKSRMVTKIFDLSDYDPELIKDLKSMGKEDLSEFIATQFQLDLESDDDVEAIDKAIEQLKRGDEVVELVYEEIESFPQIDVPLPTKVIVPSYTTDVKFAQRLTFEYFLMVQEIERLMGKGIYRKKDLKTMSFSNADKDIVEESKARNEGATSNLSSGDLYRIHETLCWMKEDGEWKRKIVTLLADCGSIEDALLSIIDFPFEFDGWNYVKHDNEIKDPRYYSSRGIPEQIRAYQEIMERGINNMLIRDEMNNTPMWEVLSGSQLMGSHIQFVPGMKLPVKSIGQEIAKVDSGSSADIASNAIMQIVKAHVEEYQSSNDFLFRNATNTGGGKTLGEIQVGMHHNNKPISMEVAAWNNALSKVYRMVFDILSERLGESMWLPDGTEVTKDDFNFPAEVRSNGDIEMADSQLQSQRAYSRLVTLLNPGLEELVSPEDKYNIVRDWLEREGSKDPDEFITSPEDMMEDKSMQMKRQLEQMGVQLGQMQQAQVEQQKRVEASKKIADNKEAEAKAQEEFENEMIGALDGFED